HDHVLFEKQTFDVFSNPKIDVYLRHLKPERVVVYGVATDYCVKAAVESLLKRNYRVELLTDAIKAVDPSAESEILANLQKQGARLTTFAELKSRL
ncbi:MAG TPA: isochorismatase family protein, partial [Caldithrix abyssi]|nr:isochorismatase family protein [Caldithrix abyssi]